MRTCGTQRAYSLEIALAYLNAVSDRWKCTCLRCIHQSSVYSILSRCDGHSAPCDINKMSQSN